MSAMDRDGPREMILRQPFIQRRWHQHHRRRLKRPRPFGHTSTSLNAVIDDRVNMLKFSRREQTIRIAYTQFFQTTTPSPGNRTAF